MPVHDWSRVDAGIFHDFHNVWIAELRNQLNRGLLPKDYYAMCEQHASKRVADILTLMSPRPPDAPRRGGIAVIDAPPKVSHQLTLSASLAMLRRTVAIRHVSEDRLIAVLEIVSPSNKDRAESVEKFLSKLEDLLAHGIHVMLVDVFAPGKFDPLGLHAALLHQLGEETEFKKPTQPVSLASYVASFTVDAYWENIAFGDAIPEMPLFLDPDIYINAPLETAYQASWLGTPARWREVLEKPHSAARRKRGR